MLAKKGEEWERMVLCVVNIPDEYARINKRVTLFSVLWTRPNNSYRGCIHCTMTIELERDTYHWHTISTGKHRHFVKVFLSFLPTYSKRDPKLPCTFVHIPHTACSFIAIRMFSIYSSGNPIRTTAVLKT